MLWAYFSYKGSGNLVRVHNTMDSLKYQNTPNTYLVISVSKLLMGHYWVFHRIVKDHLSFIIFVKSTKTWYT